MVTPQLGWRLRQGAGPGHPTQLLQGTYLIFPQGHAAGQRMMPATGCSGVLCTCPRPSNVSQEECSGKIQSLVILYTFVYFELFIPTSMCDFCDKIYIFKRLYNSHRKKRQWLLAKVQNTHDRRFVAWTQEDMAQPCQMSPIGETCPTPCPWQSLPRGEKPLLRR